VPEQPIVSSPFPDLQPDDWAYQALRQLTDQHGCLAGMPVQAYAGNCAISRFEAAALLLACLQRMEASSESLKPLITALEQELLVLQGRLDAQRTKVGVLEAMQFSPTTKLKGLVNFDLGVYGYRGTAKQGNSGPGGVESLESALTFNYQVRLNFDSSFTGKDLLRIRLISGNYADSAFNGSQYRATKLVRTFQSQAGPEAVDIDRLYYVFPISSAWQATVGSRVRNTEMLGIQPSVYQSGLGDFLYGTFGASGVYNKQTGGGVGITWRQYRPLSRPYIAAALNTLVSNASEGDPSEGGLFTDRSAASLLAQFGVVGPGWGLVAGYRYGQCGTDIRVGTQYTYSASKTACDELRAGAATNNLAVNAYWQPRQRSWLPSISTGWGLTAFNQGYISAIQTRQAQSWMVGLQWKEVLAKGNRAGLAVGAVPFTTVRFDGQAPRDGNTTREGWYDIRLSDAISLTPALFYQNRPAGQNTPRGETFNALGGLLRMTLQF